MVDEERLHARVLGNVLAKSSALEGSALARIEGRHRNVGGNALRAAVLGANDGLSSNLSLLMGVAGATADRSTILLTGLAGLLAGACSMALGEWVSVTSARELAQREVGIERSEVEQNPTEEREELQVIYEAKGLTANEADRLSRAVMRDERTALDTLSREELGVDRGDHVVPALCRRRDRSGRPVLLRDGHPRGRREPSRSRRRALRHRRGHLALHPSQCRVVRNPPASPRLRCCRRDLRDRPRPRRRDRRLGSATQHPPRAKRAAERSERGVRTRRASPGGARGGAPR